MRVLVLGAGVSGQAAARLLRRHGNEAVIFDDRPESFVELRDEGFEMHGGPWHDRYLRGAQRVIASPGFSEHSDPIIAALESGLELWSELELGWRHADAPVVAVTGTNGKTTTTELVAAMASSSGIDAAAAGNIGEAMSDVVERGHELIVAEASSFQLRFIRSFAPAAAIVTNVAPDHLDWHRSMEGYVAAKARIAENMEPDDPLAFDGDDPGATALVASLPVRKLPVSGVRRDEGGGISNGVLWVGDDSIEVGDQDPVLAVDIALAAVIAAEMGATTEGIASAVKSYQPGPHRRSLVEDAAGVTWVDDSKATNPHAAAASVGSYGPVILIAGGRAKGLDVRPLAALANVKNLIAIGEAAPELLDAAGERGRGARDIEEAVAVAATLAEPGDTVLLAPGCASFDQFESYAARGEAFTEAVKSRRA